MKNYSNFFWAFCDHGYISEPRLHGDGVERFEVDISDPVTRWHAEEYLSARGFVISHRNSVNPARIWVESVAEVTK